MVNFSMDGTHVMIDSRDGIQFWDVVAGQFIATVEDSTLYNSPTHLQSRNEVQAAGK